MTGPRVHVHIDAIALRGFTPSHRNAIVAGLREELARSFAAAGAGVGEYRSVASVHAGRLLVRPGTAAAAVGRAAAQRVAGSLRP